MGASTLGGSERMNLVGRGRGRGRGAEAGRVGLRSVGGRHPTLSAIPPYQPLLSEQHASLHGGQ